MYGTGLRRGQKLEKLQHGLIIVSPDDDVAQNWLSMVAAAGLLPGNFPACGSKGLQTTSRRCSGLSLLAPMIGSKLNRESWCQHSKESAESEK
jgi:hypothetical protein